MSIADPTTAPVADGTDDYVTAIGYLVLAGTLVAVSGPPGLLAGAITAATWYTFGTPYAIAVGHVALVASVPDIGWIEFAIVELAFVAVLLGSARTASHPRRFGAVALASGTILGGITWSVLGWQPLWVAASAFVLLFVLVAYGLHRYEFVVLGYRPDRSRFDGHPPEGNE